MNNSQFKSGSTTDKNAQISQYLPGFYGKNIPWWPFVVISIAVAVIIGISINFNLGFSPTYIPAGIIALFVVILILQKPEIGAYILIVSVFTNISDILTDRGFPGINRPLIALTVGSVLINYFLKTGKYTRFPKLSRSEWSLMGYYLAIIVSIIVLPDKSNAFDTIIDITKDILVGISVYITLNTQERWKSGASTLLITVAILAAIGVFKTMTGIEETFFDLARNSLFGQVGEANELRYGGPIGEPNLWGQVLVSTLPFIIYTIRFRHSFKKILLLAFGGVLILLAMIYTSSRGAMVALLLITPFIAMDMKVKPASFLAGTLLFFALISILPENYANRFSTLNIFSDQDALTQDEAVSGRQTAMRIGLEMFRDNPVLGVGFGKFRENYWKYAEKLGLESNATNIDFTQDAQYAHSLYIEVVSETGLVGLLAFSVFLGTLLVNLYKIRKRINDAVIYKEWSFWVTALIMSISTFLVSGLFLHGVFFRFIWVLIGLAMAAISLSENIRPAPLHNQKNKKRKIVRQWL